jgi:hypothetical protein
MGSKTFENYKRSSEGSIWHLHWRLQCWTSRSSLALKPETNYWRHLSHLMSQGKSKMVHQNKSLLEKMLVNVKEILLFSEIEDKVYSVYWMYCNKFLRVCCFWAEILSNTIFGKVTWDFKVHLVSYRVDRDSISRSLKRFYNDDSQMVQHWHLKNFISFVGPLFKALCLYKYTLMEGSPNFASPSTSLSSLDDVTPKFTYTEYCICIGTLTVFRHIIILLPAIFLQRVAF